MNLMRIKYFVEVAKWNSFSKAAQMLYVSQPNLSRQVALMEQEVGFELFRRTGKNIQLTRAGEYLYEQLKDISEKTELAISNAEAISRRESCSLSIGVLEGQDTSKLLSPYLDELRFHNPRLNVELESNNFRALRQGLDRGIYDVLLTMEFELEGQEEWDSLILGSAPGAVAVNSSHPLAGRESATTDEFKNDSFVVISKEVSQGGYDLLFKQCANSGFVPNVVRETSNMESLFLCVEMGIGVAILDRNTRMERNSDIRFVSLPNSLPSGLALVWKKENNNPMVKTIVEAMRRGIS